MNKVVKIVLVVLIIGILLMGIIYCIKNYKGSTENKIKTNFFTLGYEGGLNPGIDDYKFLNTGFYYKKLYTYEEYIQYKERFNQILTATEEEFEENFMIIILVENESQVGLVLDNYYIYEDALQIDLIKDKNINPDKTNGNAILIKKDMDREKINIEKIAKDMNMQPYKYIKELPSDYSREQAIKDNCVFTDLKEMKTYNKELFNQFISDVNNNKSCNIRICRQLGNSLNVIDIEYVAGKKFNIYTKGNIAGELGYQGETIYTTKIEESKLDDRKVYTIKDEMTSYDVQIYINN